MLTYILLSSPFGNINPPEALKRFGTITKTDASPIGTLITLFVQLLIVGAGIFALFNFILAGYGYLSAGGDSKKIADASAKIWQSALGLAVAAGSVVLAAIFGRLIFGDAGAILNPRIPLP